MAECGSSFVNDVLDARNFFLSPSTPKAPLRQNQFGGEIGGPVLIPKVYDGRNKTFFMFDYEGLRLRKQANGPGYGLNTFDAARHFHGKPGLKVSRPESRFQVT